MSSGFYWVFFYQMSAIILIIVFFFFFFNLLFLAVLGLRCCVQAFSSCGSGGHSSLWCSGFSLRWPLLFRSMGSRRKGFISCGTRAQAAPWHVGSSRCRARTRVPCIGRRILNHRATREAPYYCILKCMCPFSLTVLKIFSLILVFSSLTMMSLGVVFLILIIFFN